MPTTVYFATNRRVNGAPDRWQSYSTGMVPPSDPNAVTYGTAFVDNSNLTADTTGAITAIQDIQQGGFSETAIVPCLPDVPCHARPSPWFASPSPFPRRGFRAHTN